jgi:dTDP-4-amino-4,6-dideoxygalactose transaminase
MSQWGASAELPATDELARTNVAIPMSPVLTDDQANEVVAAVKAAVVSGTTAKSARTTTSAHRDT